MAHTPGPWWIEEPDDPAEDDRHISDSEGNTATVYGDPDTATANARLIAAAPELLEALRDLLDGVLENGGFGSIVEAAGEAIAKAEGRDY